MAEKRQERGIRGGYVQVKTVEVKESYLKAKRATCHAVRNAKIWNWEKMGEALQGDFQHNQKKFWVS